MNKKSFWVKGLTFAMGTLLFAACTNTDNPYEDDPFIPGIPEMVMDDITDVVKTDGWGGGWCATQYAPAVTTSDGRTAQMMENYQGNVDATGVLLSQTITGLENGLYYVEVYANAFFTDGRGFSSDMADGATDVAYVFANDDKVPVVGKIATATDQNGEYALIATVTDGTLTIGLGKEKAGTNWHTIQIKSLTMQKPLEEAYEQALEVAKELMFAKTSQSAADLLKVAVHQPCTVENYEILQAAILSAMASAFSYELIDKGELDDSDITGWECTNPQGIHINTWSVEGNPGNDPTGMVTPFIENWVYKDNVLGDGMIFYSLPYLEPGETYTVSALIRAYSEAGNDINGASFFVGDGTKELSSGNAFEYNGMKGIYDTYTATGTVNEYGILTFGVKVEGATFNWIAIKDVKISK